ncbi:MAG: hypothetical protein ABSG53_14420 [Thermoguttaceae bacterium]|jgi:hypothetical protein
MRYVTVITLVLSAATLSLAIEPSSQQPTKAAVAPLRQSLAVEKAFISFRIGPPQWMPEDRYGELLALFEKYKGVTNEITFFTSFTHPPLPLNVVRQRCELLAKRMPQARAFGYRAGINILATIGHHEENLPNSLAGNYTNLTDIDGNLCRGSFCPNDPRVQEYVREVYQIVTAANPDYIWIDDDVRLAGHMPVYLTCFCDRCLAVFAKESGKKYTRASLKSAFLQGPPEQRVAVCRAWLNHNRATINRLFALIERTVHGAKPGLPLGFMTGDRFYEGYDFDNWAKALAGPANAPVYWRPGGGFYEDSWTAGLVGKSHDIGRQVSKLPPSILSIQSEIENFPYQRLKKAVNTTVLEAASHMGAGCTGAAFNVLSGNNEPLDEFEPMIAQLHRARPFYDLMAKHLGRAESIGLFTAWDKDSAVATEMFGGAGFFGESAQVFEIGLPAAYDPKGAVVTLLFPQSLATMSKDQITKTLSSGVYTDAATLNALNQMGFQELTGLAVDGVLPIDCIEELSNHPLNAPFVGRQRDCRQSFNHAAGFALRTIDPKAQMLARLVDYGGKEKATTSMAVFENRLGGRICVAGYFPWTFLHSLSKSAQMKSIARWLSKDQLPAYVASYHKVNLWARQPPSGCLAIALVNTSFDSADDLSLALLTRADQITVYDMEGKAQVVRVAGRDGPYHQFTLPHVPSWSACLVTTAP